MVFVPRVHRPDRHIMRAIARHLLQNIVDLKPSAALKSIRAIAQPQRSGQPVKRTKTVGNPTVRVSPCKEKNFSDT